MLLLCLLLVIMVLLIDEFNGTIMVYLFDVDRSEGFIDLCK